MASIIDILSGANKVDRQKRKAIDFARERYDPSVYEPQRQQAFERATEGISEGVESERRRRTVESLFRQPNTDIYGGSQARAIAGQQTQSRQAQKGLAQFESQMSMQDIQAQQQGENRLAQILSKQRQTEAQRDAAIQEAELQAEAEKQRRRQKLGQTALGIGMTLATTPFGGGGSLLARGLGAIGGQAASQMSSAGSNALLETAKTMNQPTGAGEAFADESIETATAGLEDNMGVNLDLGQPIQTQNGQQPEPSSQPQQGTIGTTEGVLRAEPANQPQQWSVQSLFEGPVESPTSSTQRTQQRISELESRGDTLSFEEFQELDELRSRERMMNMSNILGPPEDTQLFSRGVDWIQRTMFPTQRQRYQQQYNQ